MATEFRSRLRDPGRAQSASMQAGARHELTETLAVPERDPVDMNAPTVSKSCRPSIRPSAFGIPRIPPARGSDPSEITTAVERVSSPSRPPAAHGPSAPSETSSEASGESPPAVSQVLRKRALPPRPAIKTDIEELLPISQGVKSLPLPPKFPTADTPPLATSTTRRFPWMSLSIFAVVIAASLISLARYSGERTQTGAVREPIRAEVDWPTPRARDWDSPSWSESVGRSDTLLDDGDHALAAGDPRSAQEAFVLALGDARAALGLARVRLAQGDLAGARGWAESAWRRKPDEPRYRVFLEQLAKSPRTR